DNVLDAVAIDLVDMDGDGIKDIVTGKRFWAHGPKGDIEANADPVTYFFKIVRHADKSVDFVPHLIASDVGVGTQVVAGDINGDKLPDVVIGNKKGTFALMHEAKKVSKDEWEKAQPKVLFPGAGMASLTPEKITAHTNPERAAAAKGAAGVSPADQHSPSPNARRDGIIPLGKDGQPLNLNFETGTLKDWTATGSTFAKQPVKGDTVAKRLAGSGRTDRSQHEGEYWIGGYEAGGDRPTGTLSSVPFRVTHPWASFLFAGGNLPGTRVELVRADNQQVIFTARGVRRENLLPVTVDVQAHAGKEIFIRLVDEETGGWGHINFDDFRFHAEKPVFAGLGSAGAKRAVGGAPTAGPGAGAPPNELPPVDDFKFAGLKPDEAARAMTLPPGFKAHVFAAEPDVRNPIAFCLDDRGRVWVVEGMTYPQRAVEGQGRDRILVFEDTNGDHKFDRRTVFMEGLNLVSGIEYGFGGVWVGAAPYLYFIPIADGDSLKPAGKPQVVLEGWGYQDTHETLNTFRWGPDGWLYGCHGVFTHSHVKPAGAPDTERQFINAGIWRYHPTKKKFEVFAEGTSNPWGMDFDERGQIFMEGCVIPHLWHMIQGARYQRQGGQHYLPSHEEIQRNNPDYFQQDFSVKMPRQPFAQYVYDDIRTIADHVHYAGKTPHGGNSRSASAGGGHAHAGLMVYLGGSWPEQYRGKLFMNNIHGARMNMDIPERAGSGFVGHHGADFLIANDKASQMLDMRCDQDGSVYVIDWYDLNQCHRPDRAAHDYETGRIFKIVYGETKTTKVDLQKAGDEELVKLIASKNEWTSSHARRVVQERFGALIAKAKEYTIWYNSSAPKPTPSAESEAAWKRWLAFKLRLDEELKAASDTESRLRCLWSLYTSGPHFGSGVFAEHKASRDEWVRAWAIQLLSNDQGMLGKLAVEQLVPMARSDKSPVVRLYLASAAQRLPVEQRWDILAGLVSHAEDATDHNLPLMAWYAGEPLVNADLNRALDLALAAKLPNYLTYTARRAASLGTSDVMSALVTTLGRIDDKEKQLAILTGLSDALRPLRTAPMPAGWEAVAAKLGNVPGLRRDVQSLSAKFGSATAFTALRETLSDSNADSGSRASALDALLNAKDPSLAPSLQRLLGDEALRRQAVRALATYDDAWTPWLLLAVYKQLAAPEQRDALATLASRPTYARVLVGALEQKSVTARDLTAETVRQIRSLNQPDLNAKLDEFWGTVREAAADKLKEIERYKAIYKAGYSSPGDASRGRVIFNRICAQCHTLFESGGKVGPDLTGSARADLDYILQNMVDPNAVIPNDYRASTVEMKDERSIMGIIKQADDKSVTIVTATEVSTLPRNEIKSMRQSEISMMPEGLLTPLNDQEVRDLIFYLRSPGQVPLPGGQ
ncbi:MAG TPA: PVC-type heme-binding CxxCH protein, partial [Verrucomicrobiae bacterium]